MNQNQYTGLPVDKFLANSPINPRIERHHQKTEEERQGVCQNMVSALGKYVGALD